MIIISSPLYAYKEGETFHYSSILSSEEVNHLKIIEKLLEDKKYIKAENKLKIIFESELTLSKVFVGSSLYLMGDLYFYWDENGKFPKRENALRWYSDATVELKESKNFQRALSNMSKIYRITGESWYEKVVLERILGLDSSTTYYADASFRLANIMSEEKEFFKARKIYLALLRNTILNKNISKNTFKKAKFLYADLYRQEMGCDIGFTQFMKIYNQWPEFLDENSDLVKTMTPCLIEKKKFKVLTKIITSYLKKNPNDYDVKVEFNWVLGEVNKQIGNYRKAQQYYAWTILYNQSSPYTYKSEIGIIDSRRILSTKSTLNYKPSIKDKKQILIEAIYAYYDIFLKSPYDDNRIEALFKIAICTELLKDRFNNFKMMEYISKRYPDSEWGKKAGKLMLLAFDRYAYELYENKEFKKLYEYYGKQKIYEQIGWSEQTYLLIAESFKKDDIYPMSIDIYLKLLKNNNSNEIKYLLAEAYYKNLEFDNAVSFMLEIKKLNKEKQINRLKILANANYLLGNYKKSEKYFNKWFSRVKNGSVTNEDLYAYAFSLQVVKNFPEASKYYKKLVERLFKREDLDMAKIEDIYKRYLGVIYNSGNCRKYLSEIKIFRKKRFLRFKKIGAELMFFKGNCLLNQGSIDKAKSILVEVSKAKSHYSRMAQLKMDVIK